MGHLKEFWVDKFQNMDGKCTFLFENSSLKKNVLMASESKFTPSVMHVH